MGKYVILCALVSLFACTIAEKHLLCYYGSWATYRHGNGGCSVSDLDPFMCTHLIYTFVGLNDDASIRIMDPWLELPDNWGRDNLAEFNRLKNKNPNLKTIIAIGGWNEGSARYSKMANDPTLRSRFAKNAAEFTMKHGFDGFDIDWEYPAQRDSPSPQTDVKAHSMLLHEMRQEFDKHGLLLTAATASVERSASMSYDIPLIAQYLDLINVMTYDLHGPWDPVTGHNAALYHYEQNVVPRDSFDVETAIDYWIAAGAPKEKLILGMPLYGRTFSLNNLSDTSVGAPINGPGMSGQYTGENGFIGLNELCEKRLTQSWPESWDDVAKVPYTSNNRDWITYENEESLRLKAELAVAKGLGGVMVWSIETDDFKAVCHPVKFPYLRVINKAIGRDIGEGSTSSTSTSSSSSTSSTTESSGSSDSTSSSTSSSSSSSTTEGNGSDPICVKAGYVRSKVACSIFYQCVMEQVGSYKAFEFNCPGDLYFDEDKLFCNYPAEVDC